MSGGPFAGRPRLRRAAIAAGLLAMGWACVEGVLRSDWLADRVRASLVHALESATGGSVSLRSLSVGARRLEFHVYGLEVRHRELADQPPLLAVPEAYARLDWTSFLRRSAVLEELLVREPVVRLASGAEGRLGLPWPESGGRAGAVTVRRFGVTCGKVFWNGRPFEAEFSSSELEARVEFDPLKQQYAIDAQLADPRWGDPRSAGAPRLGTATLRAVVSESGIEIGEAAVRGKGYDIAVRGTLIDFRQPVVRGSYKAVAAVDSVASWIKSPYAAVGGSVLVDGEFEWDIGTASAALRGMVAARATSLDWPEAGFSVKGQFEADNDRIVASGLSGTALGGQVEASASIQLGDPGFSFAATGTVAGVDAGKLVLPAGIESFPWNTVADAGIAVSYAQATGLTGSADLTLRPDFERPGLPLAGSALVRYRGREESLEISDLLLETPEALAKGGGLFDATGLGRLAVELSAASKGSVETLAAAFLPEFKLPAWTPDGEYSFRGNVQVHPRKIPDAILDGVLAIEHVALRGAQWDRLLMDGRFSAARADIREGRLADGAGSLRLRGSVPLAAGGALRLEVSASGMSAGKLAAASGLGLPLEGSLSMDMQVSGSRARPEAEGTAALESPGLFGQRFDSAALAGRLRGAALEVTELLLARGDSEIAGTAALDLEERRASLSLATDRWTLGQTDWIQEAVPGLDGSVRFQLSGSGGLLDAPLAQTLQLSGDWEMSDLRRNEHELGRWQGTFRSGARAQGIHLDLSGNLFGGSIDGQARLSQGDAVTYAGDIAFSAVDPGRVAGLAGLPAGALRGVLAGSAAFHGALGVADSFAADGVINRAEVRVLRDEIRDAAISNASPLRWRIRGDRLSLDALELAAPGTELLVDGSAALRPGGALDLTLDGRFNMAPLGELAEGIEADGTSNVSMRLAGSVAEPSFSGAIDLAGVSVRPADSPYRVSNLRGQIAIEGTRARITELTGTSAGGTIHVTGAMDYADRGLEYRLAADASNLRVDHPRNVSSVINGKFTLAGVGAQSILEGDTVISRMVIAEGISFADLFTSLGQPTSSRVPSAMLRGMQVNVRVSAIPHLPIETSLVRGAEVDFDLDIVGSGDSPSILGTIAIAQGELNMLGTRYAVSRGDVRFVNPLQAEPVLNVELETRIRDIDITLVLSGPARNLNLSYRSDPPLPFHDLVNLVAVGKEPTVDPSIASRRRIEQQSIVQVGADNLLSQALARPLSRRAQRFFGVTRLKVDPQIGGLEANPGARISTEQQIADNLTLIYSYDVSSAQQQAIRIEWTPDRKWSFIVTRDQNGLVGSDILYKVRLR